MTLDIESVSRAIVEVTEGPVFAVPGGGASLGLLGALWSAGKDVIVPHSEMSAAVMAATTGRLSGTPGVAVTIRGPGLAALSSGLAFASLEGYPTVAISETAPDPSRTSHKWMDHTALVAASAKAYGACTTGTEVRRAAALAVEDRPGPVSLGLAESARESRWTDSETPDARGRTPRTSADPKELLGEVSRARRPLVVLGAGARKREVAECFVALGCPIATTVAAKGIVPEEVPQSAGIVTGAGGPRSPERLMLRRADLVLRVGVHPHELLGPFDPEIGAAFDLGTADANDDLMAELAGRLRQEDDAVSELTEPARLLRAELTERPEFLPGPVFAAIARCIPGSPRLVVDTGDFCTIAEHVWQPQGEDGFLGAACSRFMGVGIGMALSAALSDSGRPTVLAVGDGGIGPAFGELTLAVERRLPLLVLHLSDGGFASIRGRSRAMGLAAPFIETPRRLWWRAAQGLGMESAAISGAAAMDELSDALSSWIPSDGPMFLSLEFDTAEYQSMTEGLR